MSVYAFGFLLYEAAVEPGKDAVGHKDGASNVGLAR
jgi:hypothetical protein